MGIKKIINNVVQEGKVLFGDGSKDKTYSSKNTFPDSITAEKNFKRSKLKLFNVDQWSYLPGVNSTFQLHDRNGRRLRNGNIEKDCFIRIEIPGPYPESWVQVIKIHSDTSVAEFTVSPCKDPTENEDDVEHFFSKEASSTFKVELKGNTVQAFEIGKDESINDDGKEAGARGILNKVTATAGWVAFQEMQWEKLTDYLVHKLEPEKS